jgi:hypothetical protein
VRREFPVSSVYACVQSVRKNIREDMEDRWVTNLSEDRNSEILSCVESVTVGPTHKNTVVL